ncbi:MAG: flagellar filament capping protein FliD [Gammaproteobacteria bacterium]|nr:flagellar filament capping protein FliD [Gammaproteobacteria bacterium]
MAEIQSLGIGSGLLTADLVDQLVAAEREPVEERLLIEQEEIEAKISAFGTVNSLMSTLDGTVSALASTVSFNAKTASSSDETIITATASSIATTGRYDIVVSTLAQSHSLSTASTYATTNTTVGTGTLTFQFGTTDYTEGTDTYTSFTVNSDLASQELTIDSSNNTLAGIRDTINNANFDVSASIVNDGTGNRLVFTSSTGAAKSMEIVVTNDSGSGLADLDFNSTSTSMEQSQAAADTAVTVNGLSATSSDRVISDMVTGITFNLKKVDASTTVSIDIANDTTSASNKIQSFVDAFNELKTQTNLLTKYDDEGEDSGILLGDSTLRSIVKQLRSTTTGGIQGLSGSTITALSEVGVTTDAETGLLSYDSATFIAAYKATPEDILSLFATNGSTTNTEISYVDSLSDDTVAGDYAVVISAIAEQGAYYALNQADSYTIDSDSDTFVINVDGISSGTITLSSASYTGETMATELNTQIALDSTLKDAGKSVSVAYTGGDLVFTSGSYGSTSSVNFSSLDTNTTSVLGINDTTGTFVGADVLPISGNITIDGDNDTFEMTVNSTASGTITLTQGSYTGADLATQIQTQINADSVFSALGMSSTVAYVTGASDGHLTVDFGLTTDTIAFTTVDTNTIAELGLTRSVGLDVAGTINGATATGSGQRLTGLDGDDSEGIRVNVTSTTTGSKGDVSFIRGIGSQLAILLNTMLDSSSGIVANKTTTLNSLLTENKSDQTDLDERMDALTARLSSQFAFNDAIIATLNSTSDFLTTQFDLINSQYKN